MDKISQHLFPFNLLCIISCMLWHIPSHCPGWWLLRQAALPELGGWDVLGAGASYRLQRVSDGPASPAPLDLSGFPVLTRPHPEEAEPGKLAPFMSLLPVVLIPRGASQDCVQGFLSCTPCYAVSARKVPAPARSTRLEPPMLFTSCGCH